jgi:hypothetical protein
MVATPSAGITQAELDSKLSMMRTAAAVTIATTAIKYGALVGCVGLVYLSIAALSGRVTLASIGLNILGNLKLSEGICTALTTGSLLYGIGQRQLRHRAIKRLGNSKNELERIIDPGRSSSGLTDKGTTRPGDEEI